MTEFVSCSTTTVHSVAVKPRISALPAKIPPSRKINKK